MSSRKKEKRRSLSPPRRTSPRERIGDRTEEDLYRPRIRNFEEDSESYNIKEEINGSAKDKRKSLSSKNQMKLDVNSEYSEKSNSFRAKSAPKERPSDFDEDRKRDRQKEKSILNEVRRNNVNFSSDAFQKRLESYIKTLALEIDTKLPLIIVVGGHNFSAFTRPFKRPFDLKIHNAMVATSMDLLLQFNPSVAYTCSDEISLIYPISSHKQNSSHYFSFGNNVQTIVSLVSGYSSLSFYRNLGKEKFDASIEKELINHMYKSRPRFHVQVFQVPDNSELLYYLYWKNQNWKTRSLFDIASYYFKPQKLQGLYPNDIVIKLRERNIEWEEMPNFYKFGTFVKKHKYEKVEINEKEEKIKSKRTRAVTRSFDFNSFSPENENFIFCKYWNE